MLTRADIEHILFEQGYKAQFQQKHCYSAKARTPVVFNVRARRPGRHSRVHHLASESKIAQMSDDELRQLLASKLQRKVEVQQ